MLLHVLKILDIFWHVKKIDPWAHNPGNNTWSEDVFKITWNRVLRKKCNWNNHHNPPGQWNWSKFLSIFLDNIWYIEQYFGNFWRLLHIVDHFKHYSYTFWQIQYIGSILTNSITLKSALHEHRKQGLWKTGLWNWSIYF